MIANINHNNTGKIKLPSISELTKSTDIKLPSIAPSPSNSPASLNHGYYNYNNYTHQQSGRYNQQPQVLQQLHQQPVHQVPMIPHPQQINTPPQQMATPPQKQTGFPVGVSPIQHNQYSMNGTPPQPQQQQPHQHSMVSPPPGQRMYQLPPYYPIYYNQPTQLPSPSSTYMVPEVVNKPINKCHRCGTTETPEWRRGPNGVRTLCNACGLYHAKLVKRKGAAVAAQEVLNNKVCKGKNGRRIAIKKGLMNNKMNMKINLNKTIV